jgi:hypothetical protein
MLDDTEDEEEDWKNDDNDDADEEFNQDAIITATTDPPNQEQEVDEDAVSEFGDHEAGLDDSNVAAPTGIPTNVEEEEQKHEQDLQLMTTD